VYSKLKIDLFILKGQYGVWIPLLFMGSVCIVIGLVSTLLPETLNENLPQTVEEGNIFGSDQKYFSWAKYVTSSQNDLSNYFCRIFSFLEQNQIQRLLLKTMKRPIK